MKESAFAILMTIILGGFCLPSPATCQEVHTPELQSAYASMINDVIDGCEMKSSLRFSKSENLRRTAALGCMKVAFFEKYKADLIKDMIELDIGTMPYKVRYYLNKRFFEVIRP